MCTPAHAQAFEQVEPVDVTRICLRIRDVSVHFTPPSASARVVLTIGHLSLRTKLVPDSPETMLKFSLAEARALVIDQEVSKSVETLRPAREAVEYWTVSRRGERGAIDIARDEKLNVPLR